MGYFLHTPYFAQTKKMHAENILELCVEVWRKKDRLSLKLRTIQSASIDWTPYFQALKKYKTFGL